MESKAIKRIPKQLPIICVECQKCSLAFIEIQGRRLTRHYYSNTREDNRRVLNQVRGVLEGNTFGKVENSKSDQL